VALGFGKGRDVEPFRHDLNLLFALLDSLDHL
jgi:hypothetical protein